MNEQEKTLLSEQRKVVADVEDCLRENLKDGHSSEAADLANLTAHTLSLAGRWDLAVGAYKAFSGMLEKSNDARLSGLAQTMAASEQRLSTIARDLPPRENVEVLPRGRMVLLDLKGKFNWRALDVSGGAFHGNGIAELPKGEPILGGGKFRTSDEMMQLGCAQLPTAPAVIAGIPVNRKIANLYFLHAVQYGRPSRVRDGDRTGPCCLGGSGPKWNSIPRRALDFPCKIGCGNVVERLHLVGGKCVNRIDHRVHLHWPNLYAILTQFSQ